MEVAGGRASERLFLLETPEEREGEIATLVERFWQKLDTPPGAFPVEMPMTAVITHGLISRQRPAATALDNSNMLYQVVADVLMHRGARDKAGAVTSGRGSIQ